MSEFFRDGYSMMHSYTLIPPPKARKATSSSTTPGPQKHLLSSQHSNATSSAQKFVYGMSRTNTTSGPPGARNTRRHGKLRENGLMQEAVSLNLCGSMVMGMNGLGDLSVVRLEIDGLWGWDIGSW